ncbi:MAG: FCD domain-containing protein [Actinobacteria bacterium]|uniref:Unannotated protein n=2 Tax=freshwater metagenome TaxID=449393 RepID=A0A6J7LB05_9ZZZZ|nr:FCD domain-containing protein [Actinomycetota bacterium]
MTRLTAAATVLAELRRAISTGELAPGQQLVQESLAERLGVSRVPLREALQVLEGEGQVVHEPHRGYFVTELSLADLVEVYHLRSVLEAEAARTAVPLLTDADVESLQRLVDAVNTASGRGDIAAMIGANRAFHLALVDAARMPRLSRLVSSLWDATDVYRSVYYGSAPNRERVDHEHAAIMAAIRSRDVAAVIVELDAHREHAVAELAALMG